MPRADPVPPPILYHYTNALALESILAAHRLRATNVEFMNDASEIIYARELVEQVLGEKIKSLTAGVLKTLLSQYATQVDHFGSISVFALCFCESGDLLSQWRGYHADYAIGLDGPALVFPNHNPKLETAIGRKWITVQVRYDPAEQRRHILECIDDEIADWKQAVAAYGEDKVLARANLLINNLEGRMAPRILKTKNPRFYEEHEWRAVLMIGVNHPGRRDIEYRTGPTGDRIPFVSLDLARRADPPPRRLPVIRIFVAPPVTDAARRRALQALANSGYTGVDVIPSKIPLR